MGNLNFYINYLLLEGEAFRRSHNSTTNNYGNDKKKKKISNATIRTHWRGTNTSLLGTAAQRFLTLLLVRFTNQLRDCSVILVLWYLKNHTERCSPLLYERKILIVCWLLVFLFDFFLKEQPKVPVTCAFSRQQTIFISLELSRASQNLSDLYWREF